MPALRPARPAYRRLNTYAFDPSLDRDLQAAVMNRLALAVPWEEIGPGPVGEYLEVVDFDPASDACYEPVDLNDPYLLACDGLAPSDGNPKFHQQMVYAVGMATIRNFELALGRRALWSPIPFDYKNPKQPHEERYVQRLRVHPHAMREANAYYSPEKKALLFGYFPAAGPSPGGGGGLPGGMVFTCLSHDVVAHETTHALLDGMHRRFIEPSNPDVLAFHEAFADIVALFQRFSYPEVLRHQIARTRGNLADENLLGQLAQEVGQAIGHYGALRDALGGVNPATGKWERSQPDPTALGREMEPHDRGSVLVAAVFDAFISIYQSRVADLIRIATNGTGVLAPGAIHPDLVNRLAGEAAKSSKHVLTMCIRALDYCPAVDITFGEYLRALITADFDLVPDDSRGYRTAIIEAFRRRGIFPSDVRTLSVDSLRWRPPEDVGTLEIAGRIFDQLHRHDKADQLREFIQRWDINADRRESFVHSETLGGMLHWVIEQGHIKTESLFHGLDAGRKFQVSSVRPTRRTGPDGNFISELVIEIAQGRREFFSPERAKAQDGFHRNADGQAYDFMFRGGCTLVVNLDERSVRYNIVKNINSRARLERQREFMLDTGNRSLHATYYGMGRTAEPFAALHRHF